MTLPGAAILLIGIPCAMAVLTGLALAAEAPATDQRAGLLDRCRGELAESDTFKVIQTLGAEPDSLLAADVYGKLQNELYSQTHDVPKLVAISQAGIQFCLNKAQQLGEGEPATKLRGQAKALAYNLASFAWPGWDEKGIVLDRTDVLAGFDAARLNLRLAEELKRGVRPMADAHWVLGAHQMGQGQHAAARASFAKALGFARQTDDKLLPAMLQGYVGLSLMLEGGAAAAQGKTQYDVALTALDKDGSEDAKVYADQLRIALRVYSRLRPTTAPSDQPR